MQLYRLRNNLKEDKDVAEGKTASEVLPSLPTPVPTVEAEHPKSAAASDSWKSVENVSAEILEGACTL